MFRMSWNTLENVEEYFWKNLEYLGSSSCSGEQYLPMLTVEFAKKTFHSGEKMQNVEAAGMKQYAPSQKSLENAKKHSRILLLCVFNRLCLIFMLPTSIQP